MPKGFAQVPVVDPADQKMGARIAHWRKKKGLTIRKLAEQLEISKSALSRIERGEQSLRPRDLEHLLAVFDTTIGRFYGTAPEARAS